VFSGTFVILYITVCSESSLKSERLLFCFTTKYHFHLWANPFSFIKTETKMRYLTHLIALSNADLCLIYLFCIDLSVTGAIFTLATVSRILSDDTLLYSLYINIYILNRYSCARLYRNNSQSLTSAVDITLIELRIF